MDSCKEPNRKPGAPRDNLQVLIHLPIFTGLPTEPLKLLAYLCKRQTYLAGERIFQQDQPDSNAYLILAGKARLLLEEPEEIPLMEMGEKDFVGGLALFCDTDRIYSLRAETDVECLVLSRERFQKTLEQYPEIGPRIFEATARAVLRWQRHFVRHHLVKCAAFRSGMVVPPV
jgi:CRP-like cAMP-binding protein